MKLNNLLAIAAISLLVVACAQSAEERITASGIKVQVIEKGNGNPLVDSTVVRLHMDYVNSNGNVQWSSDKAGGPAVIPYDEARWKEGGALYEAFTMLSEGDSAVFEVGTHELFKNTFRAAVPDSLDSASTMTFHVRLLSIMTMKDFETFQKAEYEEKQAKAQAERAEAEKQRLLGAADQIKKDGEIIDKFLAENNIAAQTTESGLRYVITQEGSGENAPNGANITVHYNGTLLDGTKFDSSYDRNSPFQFVLGQGRVIKGWDEGLALLNKGAKATLYIPSSLGYGERGSGKVILPNSILKFDVELLDF